EQFTEVADIIAAALTGASDAAALRGRVSALAAAAPLYQGLEDWKLI
ncbi:MAG: serine hydroxymethyltransferase, partial [Rhodococcus ruber]|nr:serine hydroxymethyltransferase [Rhodococcus ruber]